MKTSSNVDIVVFICFIRLAVHLNGGDRLLKRVTRFRPSGSNKRQGKRTRRPTMGGQLSCCKANTPRLSRKLPDRTDTVESEELKNDDSGSNLQHISEREPEDFLEDDPSTNPSTGPLFIQRSRSDIRCCKEKSRKSHSNLLDYRPLKKSSSCSTIYIDESTVSHPNLKSTIKSTTLAIYYHIKNRSSNRHFDIFDEKLHPLSKDTLNDDVTKEPDQRSIYRFVRTLFNAAQLSPECAIITLVYLERLLTYAEVDMLPTSWKRIVLGAILLSSKVWDDQAVWNVDYCQILKDITVEDMNELERNFLELLQFNINVPASVYAKYYFDLRALAEQNDLNFPAEPLSKDRAQKLEAMSRLYEDKFADVYRNGIKKWSSVDNVSPIKRSNAILS